MTHQSSAAPARALTLADVARITLMACFGVVAALVAYYAFAAIAPDLVKAASGDSIIQPSGGGAIQDAARTIKGNALWLIMTGIGTAIIVVGLALAFGVRDASNWAFRIAGAIVLMFVIAPIAVN